MLLVFSPKNIEELSMSIEKIKKYSYSAIVGNYFIATNKP
jgi:hypothetical protein